MTRTDYYVHERGTVSGGTVYEPMLAGQDPETASTTPQFKTREEADVWIALARGEMVTATYTDPTTGWQTRVEVANGEQADTDRRLLVIRNADEEIARVPSSTLSEFHREQADNREYLPASAELVEKLNTEGPLRGLVERAPEEPQTYGIEDVTDEPGKIWKVTGPNSMHTAAIARAAEEIHHDPEGRCEWFARCENPADGTVAHPVLGDVPTCQRCADRFELTLVKIGAGR